VILLVVAIWIVASLAVATAVLVLGQLRVERYSGSHVVAHLTIAGRGVYLARTADGSWLRLVVRERRRRCGWLGDAGEPPPDIGVREPRRPPGHGPKAGTAEAAPPDA
jgi:hypothetical protein